MTEPLRLGIGLPCYGYKLDASHAAMWLGLGAALMQAIDKVRLRMFIEYDVNGVDLCRNTIVHDAMTAGCDWVFMVDADTFHRSTTEDENPDAIADAGVDIIQMIRDADRGARPVSIDSPTLVDITMPKGTNGVGLVGAPVRGRGGETGVCVRDLDEHPIPLQELIDRVQPVGRIGGACSAVNCNWLRKFWPKPPWFEMTHDYSGRPHNLRGEDYSICDGIWQRGGVVLCDGRFVPEHVDRRRLVKDR